MEPLRSAARPAFTYDPQLSWWVHEALELASEYTGSQKKRIPRPVYVRCYTSDTAFDESLVRAGGSAPEQAYAYYLQGTGYVNLRRLTCARAHQFVGARGSRRPVITELTAGAMAILLHESLHRQGMPEIANDRDTNCYADTATKFAGWWAWYQYVPEPDNNVAWSETEHWGDWAMKLAFQFSQHYIDGNMPESVCREIVFGKPPDANGYGGIQAESWSDFVGPEHRN